jgi:folylpolyglutamate synthase/dihydropteroate synthase
MKDKDLDGILRPLARRAAAVVTTRPDVLRAADARHLAGEASRWCARSEAAGDPAAALDRARDLARESGTFVLVAGSLYLVGETLRVLEGHDGPGPVSM